MPVEQVSDAFHKVKWCKSGWCIRLCKCAIHSKTSVFMWRTASKCSIQQHHCSLSVCLFSLFPPPLFLWPTLHVCSPLLLQGWFHSVIIVQCGMRAWQIASQATAAPRLISSNSCAVAPLLPVWIYVIEWCGGTTQQQRQRRQQQEHSEGAASQDHGLIS